jgi:hypothetical protein
MCVCVAIWPGADRVHVSTAEDAQQVYLHPLDMRILQRDCLAARRPLPSRVEGRIVQVDEITQSEACRPLCVVIARARRRLTLHCRQEMRRRYKPFAHLPLSCEYALVELDMAELVASATLHEFACTCAHGIMLLLQCAHFYGVWAITTAELAARRRRRQAKATHEDERRRRDDAESVGSYAGGDSGGGAGAAGWGPAPPPSEDTWGPPLPPAGDAGGPVARAASAGVAGPGSRGAAPAWADVATGRASPQRTPSAPPREGSADGAPATQQKRGKGKTVLLSTGSLRRY